MIDRSTVQRIMDVAQIVDVVSDFVSLRRAGANYKGLCPFHDDKTPSFMVSPSKNYCKCFACGKGGNPVGFIMEMEQMTYPDALRYLAKKYSIHIEEREQTEEERRQASERESMFLLNEFALKFFQEQMFETVDGRSIGLAYFRSRGFRDDIIRRFQLGFSPDRRDALAQAALSKGYSREMLLATGLCYERTSANPVDEERKGGTRGSLTDRFHGRVIFPIFTMGGKVAGFGGRVLDAATKGVNVKYQNSPESIIYSKRRELYGLYQAKAAIAKKDCCFLVEGYTDVMAMHQMGVENVVSSSGTALTNEQIALIRRLTTNIVVIYDGDAAGIKASQRGIDMLLAAGMNVRLLLLPDGHDPDSFARGRQSKEYQEYIDGHQVDFLKYKTDLLLSEAKGDPIRLSQLTQNIVQSISVIQNDITRQFYIRQAAQAMSLREATIQKAVESERKKGKGQGQPPLPKREERGINRPLVPSPEGNVDNGTSRVEVPPANFDGTASKAETDVAIFGDVIPLPSSEDAGGAVAGDVAPLPSGEETQAATDGRVGALLPPTEGLRASERELIKVVVRYGTNIMGEMECENGEVTPVTVAQYVDASMQEDELEFENPVYGRLLAEALAGSNMQMLMGHPDPEIQAESFALGTDSELLSKMYSKQGTLVPDEERLADLVPHLVADYKLAIVSRELKRMMYSLRLPEVMADPSKAREIMQQMRDLSRVQKQLAHICGDRVLNV